jgi:hypothetical protein
MMTDTACCSSASIGELGDLASWVGRDGTVNGLLQCSKSGLLHEFINHLCFALNAAAMVIHCRKSQAGCLNLIYCQLQCRAYFQAMTY